MSINLAKRASDKLLESFKKESFTEGIFNERYKWTGVYTLQVYTIDSLPLQDYNRSATSESRFGTLTELGDTLFEMSVTDDKCFNGAIDKHNYNTTMMVKSASAILKKMTNDVIIPYTDTYRLKKLSDNAGITVTDLTLTSANIVEEIFKANALMSNNGVPKKGRVLFIGETTATALKLADQVIGVNSLAEKCVVNGVCGTIDGVQVRVVPDSYMPEDVGFMIVKKGCAVAPVKVETYRVIENDRDIDGAVVQGRILQDCHVLYSLRHGVLTAKTA